MGDLIIDSSVVAKWILPESDSAHALQLLTDAASNGDRLIVLDLMYAEVANAIWKRHHRQLITRADAAQLLDVLVRLPIQLSEACPS